MKFPRNRILGAVVGAVALVLGVGAAIAATQATVTEEITVPYTIAGQTGQVVLTDTDEVVTDTVTVTTNQPDCSDTLDNDADGLVDMADGGCATADDAVEAPNPACSDGIDNDGDSLIDFPADPGCRDIRDTGEFNSTTPPPTTTTPPPTTTTPPPGDTGTVTRTNQRYTCDGPVDLDLVKVTIDADHFVTPAVQIAAGCTGNIDRIEIDNANGDGIHVGAFAHDLTVGGGYVRSPLGGCTLCGALHVDGIQVLGGQRITFNNMDVNYQTASNSALYINQGSGGQDRPTDVVFDHSTFRRQPTRNRVVRIGDSLRSGIRNSTVYYCGSGPTCDAPTAPAIWFNGLQTDPVNENNTVVAVG